MIEVIDPLMRTPGVRCAVLATLDGVPIVSRGDAEVVANADGGEALSGLVAGWLASLAPSLGLVSWDLPQRIILRATRGTLIVRRAPTALLVLLLDSGTGAEDLRLPIEAALSRLERVTRGPAARSAPAALPARNGKGSEPRFADNPDARRAQELPG